MSTHQQQKHQLKMSMNEEEENENAQKIVQLLLPVLVGWLCHQFSLPGTVDLREEKIYDIIHPFTYQPLTATQS